MRRNGAEASMLPVLMQARSSCFPVPGSKQQRETKSRRQVVTTSSALRLIKSQRQATRRHFIFIYHTCETVYIVLSYDTSFLLLLSSTIGHNICACSDAHERLDHRVELFLRSCQRTQACSPAPESR